MHLKEGVAHSVEGGGCIHANVMRPVYGILFALTEQCRQFGVAVTIIISRLGHVVRKLAEASV